jgi:hypothetical protein
MTGGIRENSSKMLGKGRGEEQAECKYKNTKGGGPTKRNRKRRSRSEGCVRGIYIGFSKDISKTKEILWVGRWERERDGTRCERLCTGKPTEYRYSKIHHKQA